ncbi:MAG: quinolinate synthase [Phycisphaeraceae bacterium]|nr:quinolinate synthase [Phycisphaeraceae bacterium]
MSTASATLLDTAISTETACRRIAELKHQLGEKLLILGHHYQVDEVVQFADQLGDSFKLARIASDAKDVEYILFCGVHFMAESTDILTRPDQIVVLPDLAAGCSMADMANADQVETAWDALTEHGMRSDVVPITYMNSTALIKAFCGRNGGVVCTSSNAEKVITWALRRADAAAREHRGPDARGRIVFLPDQHLGRNVSYELGIPLKDMAIWDPHALPEVNLDNGCDNARVILWKGHCSVHTKFLAPHVDAVREQYPGIQVIAHPECTFEVVQKADQYGSTEKIIRAVTDSPPGSKWAIGTEINLVSRLAKQNPDKTVVSLSGINCLCSTMYRIDPAHLMWALENLVDGHVVNQIQVDQETAKDALVALDRMLVLV